MVELNVTCACWPPRHSPAAQDAVNWEAGQQVAVTTTIWKDEQENQNEVGGG